MRRISITALLIAMVITATAQKYRFGITAGINSAKMAAKYSGITVHTDGRIGMMAGINCDIKIAEQFSVQPALNFVQKGYKYKETDVNYVYTDEVRINYFEVPVNVLFKPKMREVQFFMGAGPSLAFAISGKEKENDNGTIDEWDIKFGNDEVEDDMKGIDVGLNMLTGVELHNGLNLSINYNLGLTSLVPGGNSDDGTIKNRYVGFKLGYTFGSKKK